MRQRLISGAKLKDPVSMKSLYARRWELRAPIHLRLIQLITRRTIIIIIIAAPSARCNQLANRPTNQQSKGFCVGFVLLRY
jgi:hypothetical protein